MTSSRCTTASMSCSPTSSATRNIAWTSSNCCKGDVYDEDQPEVLTKMKEMVTRVEQSEKHPWHKLLGDLTSDAFRPQV